MERYFLLLGFSTLYSGVVNHALGWVLPARRSLVGWAISGVAILMEELATNEALLTERRYSILGLFALIPWIQLAFFLFHLFPEMDFAVVKQNSTIGLIVHILPLQYLLERNSPSVGRRMFMSGIIIGLLPAIVYTRQLAINRWFNHHDLSRLLMGLVIYRMYRGVRSSLAERLTEGIPV